MLTRPEPIPIVRGEGVYLYTEDGRRLLDGISSWWVNIHGHSHPKLNAALAAQAHDSSTLSLPTARIDLPSTLQNGSSESCRLGSRGYFIRTTDPPLSKSP